MNHSIASLPGKAAGWLRLLAITAFLVVLAAGVSVPLYTDEIGWRFQERAWIDGVDKAYSDLCGPGTLAVPPWFMLPVRWFSAVTNQALADPWYVRLEGVLCAFAWVGMLVMLTVRLEGDRVRRSLGQALAFGLLGLGTLPFLMVLSRPEQPLILTTTLMLLVALARLPKLGEAGSAWAKGIAILVLAAIAASYHLKGVAFAPVALACLAVCAKGPRTAAPRLVIAAALVAMTTVAAQYWVGRFQCPADAKMAAMLAEENVASVLTGQGQWGDFAKQILTGANPLNYVWLAIPGVDMSSWLPPDLFPAPVRHVVAAALTLLWGAAIVLALFRLGTFLVEQRLGGLVDARAMPAMAILACVVVWGMSQINRNAYEAAQVLPMLAVFFVLCFALPARGWAWAERRISWLAAIAVVAALLSQAALLAFTSGPLLAASRTAAYLPDQPFSVSTTGYEEVRGDIAQAMKGAGIPQDRRRRGLLVDDVTYLAVQSDLLPFHRLGVFEAWNASIDNPAQYLLDRGSDGVVASCGNLPFEFSAVAARSGHICALSRAALGELAAPPSLWEDEEELVPAR